MRFLLCAALAFGFLPARALALNGAVLTAKGAVEVRPVGGEWHAVAGRADLADGQEIRTMADGQALLEFSDGSKLALSPNSQFAINRADQREASFKLTLGKMRAYFAGIFSSRMSVQTPTAVCAVRGTEFELSADQSGQSHVTVDEGHLEVHDNQGHNAVVGSEETLSVGANGMDQPRVVSLLDEHAHEAAAPGAVHQELNRDATRAMMEELRNRELKANEAQLGKDVVDAFGRRVRLEEYLLRPAANQFKVLFLSTREDRFDWGHVIETFHSRIPDDITQVPAIIRGTFFAVSRPKNWLTNFEFFATNTIDGIKETVALGDPVQIDFRGFAASQANPLLLWYPGSIDYTQTLSGPGVPGGQKQIFSQHEDWNNTYSGLFTVREDVINNVGSLTNLQTFVLDPTDPLDVAGGGSSLVDKTCPGPGCDTTVDPITSISYPRGRGSADYLVTTTYRDGTTVSSEKLLVSNKGEVLDFTKATADTFTKPGNYNLELSIGSSLFQGRNIDVLIAPEILAEKKQDTTTADNLNP